jgi:hypothetical protein
LAGHPNQVDLGPHEALDLPAVSRYAATTPRLLQWFDAYNAGKPYREQVRPFNFLLMFQASRSAWAQSQCQSGDLTALDRLPSVVAPYAADPEQAFQHAFDRHGGQPIQRTELKTYRRALAQYHLQPEAKFENGDYLDHGPTRRRHIQAVAVAWIGKEANRWEEQLYLGEDPEAQIEYGSSPEQKAQLRGSVLRLSQPFGPTALAGAAELSVSAVADMLAGHTNPPVAKWLAVCHAAQRLAAERTDTERREVRVLEQLRSRCRQQGLRSVAQGLALDPGNVARMLGGQRRLSRRLLAQLEDWVDERAR